MILQQLQNRNIGILGFGQEGQAVLHYLLGHGIKPKAVLDVAEAPKGMLPDGIEYVGGQSYLDRLADFDFIFRSPGVPRMHPLLAAYPDQDAIYSQTKLFFDLCRCPIVAVTGTKGKTTTTSLLADILKSGGKTVWVGGNMGKPVLDFVDQVKESDIAVLELSSFQVQDLHKSPHVGVILNVTHDHLDDGSFRPSSHSTEQEYHLAKANMIAHQGPDDFAILHPGLGSAFSASGLGKKIVFNPDEAKKYKRTILGDHNLENIAAAAAAARALGITEADIAKAISGFQGVAQRLQKVAESGGIAYYNDSASTNPDSTIAAIASFRQPVILIVGGSEKELDYSDLGRHITGSDHVKALVAVGQVAGKILAATRGFRGPVMTGAKNMAEMIAQARSVAKQGDVILLSPAAASFDMFKNSKDRGNQFDLEAVKP